MSPSDSTATSSTTTTPHVDQLPPSIVKREVSEETSDATADATVSVGSSSPDSQEDPATATTTSNTDNTNPSTPSSRKSVRFSQVQIREHGVTLGDHPGTTLGPPISIQWQHQAEHIVDVDAYENAWTSPKRRGRELLMPGPMREQLLLTDDQHSMKEIRLAQREASRIRNNRQVAVGMADLEHIEVAWQSAVRKMKRWTKNKHADNMDPAEAWIHEHKKQQAARKALAKNARSPKDRLNKSTNGRIQKTTTTTNTETATQNSTQPKPSTIQRSYSLPPQPAGKPLLELDDDDDDDDDEQHDTCA